MPSQISAARPSDLLDRAGVCLSAVCAVHCIALPAILLVAPAFVAAAIGGHAFHLVLAIVLAVIAGLAFIPGYRLHRRPLILLAGAAGVCLLVAGLIAEEGFSEAAGRTVTILGSFTLIGAHVANLVLRHRHGHACEAPASPR